MDAPRVTHDATQAYVQRIFVGIFLPGLLGALLYFALITFLTMLDGKVKLGEFWTAPLVFMGLALYAYGFVGAQSIVHAFLMEHIVNRWLHSDAAVIATSAALGALSATAMLRVFPSRDVRFSGVVVTIGTIVGLVVGRLLRRMYKKAANSASQRDAKLPRFG